MCQGIYNWYILKFFVKSFAKLRTSFPTISFLGKCKGARRKLLKDILKQANERKKHEHITYVEDSPFNFESLY